MYRIYKYTYIWLIFMVHVGKYTIHESPKRNQLVKISTPTPVGSFEDVDPLVAVMLETGLLVPKW